MGYTGVGGLGRMYQASAGLGRLRRSASGCGLGDDAQSIGCPAGQAGVWPLCYTPGPPGGGSSGGECPAGYIGFQPYCVPVTAGQGGETPAPTAPATEIGKNPACPAATPYGIPPYCYALPQPGAAPGTTPPATQIPTTPAPGTPPGQTAPSTTTPPGTATEAAGKESGIAAWWSARTDNEKYVVYGVGGVLALLVLAKLMKKKKKAYATNTGWRHVAKKRRKLSREELRDLREMKRLYRTGRRRRFRSMLKGSYDENRRPKG